MESGLSPHETEFPPISGKFSLRICALALNLAPGGGTNRFGSGVALCQGAERLEEEMKFSRECSSEREAEARERFLKAAGYQAWRKTSPDGRWQVFWLVPMPR